MPRIRTIPPEAATGELADAYERLEEAGVPLAPTVFQLSSLRPDLARPLADAYVALFRDSQLSRQAKEAISTYVSVLNQCPYCVGVHAFFMHHHGASAEQVEAARTGDVAAFTDDEDTALFLPLAEKITRHAYKVTEEDLDALRAAGWSDEKILEGIWVAAFFNHVNRLADALGIDEQDFEGDLQRTVEHVQRSPHQSTPAV